MNRILIYLFTACCFSCRMSTKEMFTSTKNEEVKKSIFISNTVTEHSFTKKENGHVFEAKCYELVNTTDSLIMNLCFQFDGYKSTLKDTLNERFFAKCFNLKNVKLATIEDYNFNIKEKEFSLDFTVALTRNNEQAADSTTKLQERYSFKYQSNFREPNPKIYLIMNQKSVTVNNQMLCISRNN